LQSLIADLMALLPDRVRNSVLGSPAHPTRLARAVHTVLNHLSTERYPLLRCHGVLDGYRMRVEWSRDRSFLYGTYEHEVVDTLMRVVRTGQVAMDVGSNHGFYALLLSRLVGLSGLVIAFEPLPANLKLLRENVELNGCENVRVVGKAVMDRHGEFELCVAGSRSTLVALQPSPKMQGPNIRVSALPLDEIALQLRLPVDFVKIDVEGAEEAVLRGASKTIREWHPTLLVELHHFRSNREDHPALPMLREWGYEIRWIDQELLTSHILATSDQRARRDCEAISASHDKVERFRDGRSTS
jgi:FkbM family methyltransferase